MMFATTIIFAGFALMGLTYGQTSNVRIEFELKRMTNAKGLLQSGSKCSMMGGSCNHEATGYIDTSVPMKGWPGSKRVESWPKLFQKKDNSPVLNNVISEDVCAGSFKEARLRVHVVDSGLTSSKLVEDFECDSGTAVAPTEMGATWSAEKECTAKFNPANNKLIYRARVYALPIASCGRPGSRKN